MTKNKTQYVCSNCGAVAPKWIGQCPDCKQWNTFTENTVIQSVNKRSSWTGEKADIINISDVKLVKKPKYSTGISEFDRALDGGLTEGGVILLGGEPGIGKSTLLSQTMLNLQGAMPLLYVSGEESVHQVADRAKRISPNKTDLDVLPEVELEKIIQAIEQKKPKLVVADSIQTIYSSTLESAPGSVSQVRECAAHLTRLAKQNNITIILVGHVTKEGGLAGPRVLEHLVDTVLYFEGDSKNNFRIIRSFKNRFGSINEIGTFLMGENGLESVTNPSMLFLSEHDPEPGSSVFVVQEGKRALLLEVQALIEEKQQPNPRILSIGVDYQRVAMLLAITQKKLQFKVSDQNVYVNIIGGLKIQDTSADLAIIMTILSSLVNKTLPEKTVIFGEVGLTGEIRNVPQMESRLSEAYRNGFTHAIVPDGKYNTPGKMQITRLKKLVNILDFFQ